MSGLLEHAESGYCEESLSWGSTLGIFLRFILSQIARNSRQTSRATADCNFPSQWTEVDTFSTYIPT